jgi:hypothetical protein
MISQVRTGEPFIQTGGRGATRGPEGKGQRAKGKGQRAPGQVGSWKWAEGARGVAGPPCHPTKPSKAEAQPQPTHKAQAEARPSYCSAQCCQCERLPLGAIRLGDGLGMQC